jgi:uncharacterized protein (DUF983 family)
MSDASHPPTYPQISTTYVAIKGRCPRCGRGKLFRNLLAVADRCAACGLDYSGHEQGDGPAFLAILLIGTLATISAAIVEMKIAPPLWVHALLWIPFVMAGSVLSLRWLKAALIAMQYQYRPEDFSKPE